MFIFAEYSLFLADLVIEHNKALALKEKIKDLQERAISSDDEEEDMFDFFH